jgi:hypothetical protein
MTNLKLYYRTVTCLTHRPSFSSVMASQVRLYGYEIKMLSAHYAHRLDMSAARHADVLFVKKPPGKESDLATYCAKEGIPHILFEHFAQALPVVQSVVSGEKTKEEVLEKGQAY